MRSFLGILVQQGSTFAVSKNQTEFLLKNWTYEPVIN